MSAASPDRQRTRPDLPQERPDLQQALLDQEEELIEHLERDQLVAETVRPVHRAQLSRPVTLSLWALRVFAVILGVMVLYTFIANLT